VFGGDRFDCAATDRLDPSWGGARTEAGRAETHFTLAVPRSGMVSLTDYYDEISPTLVIVVGFLLFVFPEPATSVFGVGLMLFGASWWFWEWGRP
jgi:hypothetical protein